MIFSFHRVPVCFFRSSNVDGRKEEEKHEKDYEKSIKKTPSSCIRKAERSGKRFLLFSLFRICKSQRCTRCSQFNDDDLCEKIHNKDLSAEVWWKRVENPRWRGMKWDGWGWQLRGEFLILPSGIEKSPFMNEFFCYPAESIMDDGKQRCNRSGKRWREAAIIKFCYPLQFEKLFSALDSWRMEPGARVDVDECGWKLAIWLSRFFPTANIIFIVVMHVILAAIAGTMGGFVQFAFGFV